MILAQEGPIHVTLQTSGTPIWLTVAAIAVSVVALLVSGLQYLSNRNEFRRVQPKLKMSVFYTDIMHMGAGVEPRIIVVSIKNEGREDTRLNSLLIYGKRTILNGPNLERRVGYDDESPPTKDRFNRAVRGFSTEEIYIDAETLQDDLILVKATFGHGLKLDRIAELNQRKPPSRKARKNAKFITLGQ